VAYKRSAARAQLLDGDELTHAMVGIGMLFAADPLPDPHIEDTLVAASVAGMEHDDLRTLGVLVAWLGVHHRHVNVDRLLRAVKALEAARVCAFWGAVAWWFRRDPRFARLQRVYDGPTLDLLRTGTAFQLRRRGEDDRFAGSPMRVPAGVLRDRVADVLSVEELARAHRVYRERLRMGPSYRADMWAELEHRPDLSPAELARATYGSFATAWQVKRDFAGYSRAVSPRTIHATVHTEVSGGS
jgi:hypothetical protein